MRSSVWCSSSFLPFGFMPSGLHLQRFPSESVVPIRLAAGGGTNSCPPVGGPKIPLSHPHFARQTPHPKRRHTRPMPRSAMDEPTVGTAALEAHRLSLAARIAGRLHARRLDRQLDAGAESGGALAAHMARLRSPAHRERLAAELRRRGAVLLCHRVVLSPRSSVDVSAVWDAAALIERVEKRLLTGPMVTARGAARLRLLLADRTGPMHRRGRGDLCSELRAVLNLL